MPRNPFDSLPTLASSPPTTPGTHSSRHILKSWARRLERCCCQTLAYFPLTFIYSLSTWAVFVAIHVAYQKPGGKELSSTSGNVKAGLVFALYVLANWSYTVAVFTSPGSPQDARKDWSLIRTSRRRKSGAAYQGLPTHEDEDEDGERLAPMTKVTAKSSGAARFCNKCQNTKPDRTHHCSSCGSCVLKMDHHCPWLATCVGLHNYKAFFLFLLYISMFSWLCFLVSASWVWDEILDESTQMDQGMHVVNTILLAVLGGIIGLVLAGFTAWHAYLIVTGQTTIESLEKTRYLTPLKKSLETPSISQQNERHYVNGNDTEQETQPLTDRLKEIHANALPSVLRPEEGETPPARRTPSPNPSASSPAKNSLRQSYAQLEAQREQDRYSAYLDELASEKLPNAFDLGWRSNLAAVFGLRPLLWGLPVCNSPGDGWAWEISPAWTEARDRVSHERSAEDERRRSGQSQGQPQFQGPAAGGQDFRWTPGQGFVNRAPLPPRTSSNQQQQQPYPHPGVPMQPLAPPQHRSRQSSDPESVDSYPSSSDEVGAVPGSGAGRAMGDTWNDVPDDFFAGPKTSRGSGSAQRGRRKGD